MVNCVIDSNIIISGAVDGIEIIETGERPSDNNIITSSIIRDNDDGLRLVNTTDNIVDSNRVQTNAQGIVEEGTSNRNIFSNNNCQGNTANNLLIIG